VLGLWRGEAEEEGEKEEEEEEIFNDNLVVVLN
jgi:hypothetical protein